MRRRAFLRRAGGGSAFLAFLASLPHAPAAAAQAADRQVADAEGSERDRRILRDLVAFTRRSFTTPNPVPFGALVARTATGAPLVRALNEVGPLFDPTAHAETQAVRAACRRLKRPNLAGYTLYTTAEPCPMCMAAILWAGLDRTVYGATIDDIAKYVAQIYVPAREVAQRSDMVCQVTGPLEREACAALFESPVMEPVYKLWKKTK
jgi:guanine deaminase